MTWQDFTNDTFEFMARHYGRGEKAK